MSKGKELAERLLASFTRLTLLILMVKGWPLMERRLCVQLVLCHETTLTFKSSWKVLFRNGMFLLSRFIFRPCRRVFAKIGLVKYCSDCGLSGGGTPSGSSKRSKLSFLPRSYRVQIHFSAKVPLKSVLVTQRGVDTSDNDSQDAVRVLDIVLRQQAAERCTITSVCICIICFHGKRYFAHCWFI